MSVQTRSLEKVAIDTIRTLSMDAVQAANSGHPGTPMALAPIAYQLWAHNLRYNPDQPDWVNRDRFVLSCGHASMLLYSMIHLAGIRGVDDAGFATDLPSITIDDIKSFRQLGSPCAGHPEFGDAAGIETTTGPLGQGVGNSVGMAIASKYLAARYNRPGAELFNFNVYALCSDGDLMEGVAAEAASLAGHLKLSNLCWLYDDNRITIEGHTDLAFSEDVAARFRGLGWKTLLVKDANDTRELQRALDEFALTEDAPTLIIVKSIIGYGSPNKADSHAAHGAPLGDEEIRLTKRAYGWPEDERFLVPPEVPEHFQNTLGTRGRKCYSDWMNVWEQYQKDHAQAASELSNLMEGRLPDGWDRNLKAFAPDAKGLATRVSSGKVLNMIAPEIPWLIGGSADLASSTMTLLDGEQDFASDQYAGRNMRFGIREHGMAATLNGMALCGLRPYGATFFVFTDYMRPSMRLSSIMHLPVLYILTHDSIGLGEDGPTHQPVEHLAACRAIPGLYVYRPADANEVLHAYRSILNTPDHPAALILSRQNVPTLDRTQFASAEGTERGGYILSDCRGTPQAILMATGSEVSLCIEAQARLAEQGIATRVVSLPCFELFDEQPAEYRDAVLPKSIPLRVACEAGIQQGWERYLGPDGIFVGMSSFGASAPFQKLYSFFRITSDRIVASVIERLR